MSKKLLVKNVEINLLQKQEEDFISLTDIAKYKNSDDPRFVIQNWMKTRFTVEFLGLWEIINNPGFNRVELDTSKRNLGVIFLLIKYSNVTEYCNIRIEGENKKKSSPRDVGRHRLVRGELGASTS